MQRYEVQWTPDALADLTEIYDFIAKESGVPDIAWEYLQTLRQATDKLTHAPLRGRLREDLRPGVRILTLNRRTVAAFEVNEAARIVTILNIFYGGRDIEALRREPD